MHRPARVTISWFLTATVALVSAVGEGWHLIPGCGHAVELPEGYILLGLPQPKTTFSLGDRSSGIASSPCNSLPCYGEDECPICRTFGQDGSKIEPANFWMVVTVLGTVSAIAVPGSCPQPRQPFDARAPPIG
jgi:hypothetical protein